MKKQIAQKEKPLTANQDRTRQPEPKGTIQKPVQEEKHRKIWNPSALYF